MSIPPAVWLLRKVSRNFHSTGTKRMGGGHGHGRDEPYYVHGEHMYDLDKMKNQKVKIPMAVSTVFCIGILVPIWATIFMQRKTASA
ncbi:hypothetical protein L6164_023739 [Bauhinia variegata]|uniref:Uncharacterized protein n=1 Tax=Bauhinia variegata TaxID=167791 RepID=A0ACB9MKS2_BAUVA|nr:hypothetical protein L6164_023739 [Bauhinia variegata]